MAVLVTAGVLRPRRFELVVAPQLGPVALAQRHDDAVGLRHVQVLRIHRQAAIARHVVRPPDLAGVEREHGRAALKAGGKDVVADHAYRRIDVDQTVQFRSAVRRSERRIPHGVAGGQATPPSLCRCRSRSRRSSLAMIGIAVPRKLKRGTCCSTDQSSLPFLRIEAVQTAVDRAHHHDLLADRRRGQQFGIDPRAPQLLARVAPSSAITVPLLEPTTTIPKPAAGPGGQRHS